MKLATTLAALAVVSLAGCGAVPSAATARSAQAAQAAAKSQGIQLYGAFVTGTITKVGKADGRPLVTMRVEQGDYKGTLLFTLVGTAEAVAPFKVGARAKGFVSGVRLSEKGGFLNQAPFPSALVGSNFDLL